MSDDNATRRRELLEQAIQIAAREDTFRAIEFLDSQGPPTDVADHYSQLLRHLYLEHKDVPLMVWFARAGIRYALEQGRMAQATDAETAENLKSRAKEMAYNLGANAWPGWRDDGIVVDESERRAGLDAARLNMRLARELNRGDEALANAHWLLGAQFLAAGQAAAAARSFAAAAESFQRARMPESRLMAEGYMGIARMRNDVSKDAGAAELKASVQSLNELGSEDARFFADQLKTAASVFAG